MVEEVAHRHRIDTEIDVEYLGTQLEWGGLRATGLLAFDSQAAP